VDEHAARLQAGDTVALERADGDWMKGVVVLAEDDGVDIVVDGRLCEGERLSVSRTVHGDARYAAPLEVVSTGPGRSRVRLVGDWYRVQTREFVRVGYLDAGLTIRSASAGAASREPEPRPPRLVDLSAGGLGFESEASYATGELLDLEIDLAQGRPVRVRGEIIRVAGRRRGESGPCRYGVRFCGMPEATRVKLMTWVVAERVRRLRGSPKPDDEDVA